MSTIGFESRRLICGYGGIYPPVSQNVEDFSDIEIVKERFVSVLNRDPSLSSKLRHAIVQDVEQRIAKSKSEYERKLVISLSSAADRSRILANNELIVSWSQGMFSINSKKFDTEELLGMINDQRLHHLMLKIPSDSNLPLSKIRQFFKKVRAGVEHVEFVETHFEMLAGEVEERQGGKKGDAADAAH